MTTDERIQQIRDKWIDYKDADVWFLLDQLAAANERAEAAEQLASTADDCQSVLEAELVRVLEAALKAQREASQRISDLRLLAELQQKRALDCGAERDRLAVALQVAVAYHTKPDFRSENAELFEKWEKANSEFHDTIMAEFYRAALAGTPAPIAPMLALTPRSKTEAKIMAVLARPATFEDGQREMRERAADVISEEGRNCWDLAKSNDWGHDPVRGERLRCHAIVADNLAETIRALPVKEGPENA